MLLVLDTSVVVKWFAEEEHTPAAVNIKAAYVNGEHELVVPDLLRYELSNAMRYHGDFDAETGNNALK